MNQTEKKNRELAISFSTDGTETILAQLDASLKLEERFLKLQYSGPQFFKIPLPIPLKDLQQAYQNSLSDIELYPWRTKSGPVDIYLGYSLNYNPDLQEDLPPLSASLGTTKVNQFFSVTGGQGDFHFLRNSYHDTYGFRKTHPLIKKHYHQLLNKLNFDLTRSRLSVLRPFGNTPQSPTAGWHRDEFVYHNLRVNIPIFTGPDYYIEIDGHDENGNYLVRKEHFELGYAYIWNTRIPHRVAYDGAPSYERVHLILGLMPWFYYDEATDALYKNEYFGQHPFELVQSGKIFKTHTDTIRS